VRSHELERFLGITNHIKRKVGYLNVVVGESEDRKGRAERAVLLHTCSFPVVCTDEENRLLVSLQATFQPGQGVEEERGGGGDEGREEERRGKEERADGRRGEGRGER
jgi:hypothetical protein